MAKTQSEKLFEELCASRGIRCRPVRAEKVRTPDYDIFVPRRKIVVEVKEIAPNAEEREADRRLQAGLMTVVHNTPGERVRKKITSASPQIKRRARYRFPGLLVLFDRGFSTRHLDPYSIRVAMCGFEQVNIAVPQDASESPYRTGVSFGPKRKLTPQHNTSISAIGALYATGPRKIEMNVYHNQFATRPIAPRLLTRYGFVQYRLGPAPPKETQQWERIDIEP